jgi:predicted dienelactone hydrolase
MPRTWSAILLCRSRKFSVLLVLLAFAFGPLAVAAADTPVGMVRLSVPGETAQRGDPANRLNVVVWYPAPPGTAVAPIAVGVPGNPLFVEGAGADDAPLAVAPARFPFVVVSHGTGGTSMDLSWLCANLAAHGYIVASVDHPGNNALEPPTVAGMTLWWQRAGDLSHVIDGVLALPRFGPRIDPARIGAAGFSLGGFTVLLLGGARSDPQRLDAFCAKHAGDPSCSGEAMPGLPDVAARSRALAASDPTYRAAAAQNLVSHRDPRVKAIFSIAPALGAALINESLTTIDVPVAFVAGSGDPILPVLDNVIPDALAVPIAELTLFPHAVGHYTFLTDCTPYGSEKYPSICRDAGPARRAIHRDTAALAVTFFDRMLPAR